MTLGQILISATCLAFGSLVQSILGFGMGIVSIPLLVWGGFSLPQAIVMVLPNVFLQTSMNCWQNRGHMPWREVGWFFLLRIISMPVGILLLRHMSASGQESTRQFLGFSVIAILLFQQTQRFTSGRPGGIGGMIAAGTASGFFAGLIGMGGPPLILWALRREDWGQQRQRSFLWFTFLLIVPWQILMMLLSFEGKLENAVILGLAVSPLVLLVAWFGAHYGNALSNDRVRWLMQIFLLLIAAQLILGRWL